MTLRRLLKDIHFSVTLANFGTIGALESAVFMVTLGEGGCIPSCGEARYGRGGGEWEPMPGI
jgi:hypothetical protein